MSNPSNVALDSREKALRVRLSAAPPLTVSDLLDRYGFANLPCDEQLLVSLSHTTKRQHALLKDYLLSTMPIPLSKMAFSIKICYDCHSP